MSTIQNEMPTCVILAHDRSIAELIVPPDMPREQITGEWCRLQLQRAGVELTSDTARIIERLVAHPPSPEQEARIVVARATPAVHGEDGTLQWLVDEKSQPLETSNGSINFHDRSPYTLVKQGQLLGFITDPTLGEDGRDVTGRTIAARPGKAVKLRLDETILRDARGQLIAQCDGMLARIGESAKICQVLEVNGDVDFSVGNIDFKGDVTIAKNVRERFVVKATGNIEVGGLIEAATIECQGDLRACGGISGGRGGTLRVGGMLKAKYLDSVKGVVEGDLHFEREAINCSMQIGGAISAPNGTIIGGTWMPTAAVDVHTLGSAAGVPTRFVLGTAPVLEDTKRKLSQIITQLTRRRETFIYERDQLTQPARRAAAHVKERITELAFEIQQIDTTLVNAAKRLVELEQTATSRRTVSITVFSQCHPGVLLDIGGRQFRITQILRGPIRISLDENGQPFYQRGEGPPTHLSRVAQTSRSASMNARSEN